MEIENIFRKISGFENIKLDTILFESKYPIMFTCQNNSKVYLFICCLVHAHEIKWIGTETNYDILIELLENKITIQNAFLEAAENKIIIGYDGKNVNYSIVKGPEIDEILLPTAGEYMDAEEDEFSEEIAAFRLRNANIEYAIQPQRNRFITFNYSGRKIILTDEYFNSSFNFVDTAEYSIDNINGQKMSFS